SANIYSSKFVNGSASSVIRVSLPHEERSVHTTYKFLRQWRRSLTSEWYGPHANFTAHACYRESPSLSTHKPNRYRRIHAI
ncbi:MAG: hypothetical protein VXZ15_00905, partial [Planctomycetota bacterium]|nr:hypothetical protein [Planctomycetota bacterium]